MMKYAAAVGAYMESTTVRIIVPQERAPGRISSKRKITRSQPVRSRACATWKYDDRANCIKSRVRCALIPSETDHHSITPLGPKFERATAYYRMGAGAEIRTRTYFVFCKSRSRDSNSGPTAYKAVALPTELLRLLQNKQSLLSIPYSNNSTN